MLSSTRVRAFARLALVLLLIVGAAASKAAPRFDVLSVDLAPLIADAARSSAQFAVDVPHPASPATAGEWSTSGSLSVWTYSVQIPGAVSMSFHATEALLPESAVLTVVAGGFAYVYGPEDAAAGELWSRIGRGDSLAFELKVATEDADRVRLEIASFQAGYRGFGSGIRNHAYYEKLRGESFGEAAVTGSCMENWVCNTTPVNEGPGEATVALVIGNVNQCSGVLLNDVPGDGAPYVLTARHCENGSGDGGSPEAAGTVRVYWNAISACGALLGSIYDPGIPTQYGAQTVVEQQDAWLIRLNEPPIIDAYYAGWDATGSAFVGGFTAHHALGTSKQFIGWYGQAVYLTPSAAQLGVHFDSTLWGTVNALGAGGAGASGAGLFDETGRLVGTVVRGEFAPSSESGVCPVNTPPVPAESTATSLSTALSGIFDATSDPQSTTGAVTIQSVLDPGGTGTRVVDGQKRPIEVTLHHYPETPATGSILSLEWTTTRGAETCTASGGESGDGWAGSVTRSGDALVTNFDGGDVTYTLTCTDGQIRTGTASVTVHWRLGAPSVYMSGDPLPAYGVPFEVRWDSNVRPCTATGGSLGDGWGGSVDPVGYASVTETVVGPVTYTVTCGSGSRIASDEMTVEVPPPTVSLAADGVTLRTGQSVTLDAVWRGAPCVKTGGAAGDGWAGSVSETGSSRTTITETTPGTYTYAMSCGSGSYVATAEATVTFTDDPPAVSVQATPASGAVGIDVITLSWDANVRPCQATSDGPAGTRNLWGSGPHASIGTQNGVIGEYVYTVTCGAGADTAQASTTVSWTGTPSVRLSGLTGAVVGSNFPVSYTTNVLPCTASGGTPGDGWTGQFNEAFHSVLLREQTVGPVEFTITCGLGALTATDTWSVDIVAESSRVTLTADKTSQLTGQPVTLSWTSNIAPCVPQGGPADGWTGTFGSSGSVTVIARSPGIHSYMMFCGTGSLTAVATVIVRYGDAAPMLLANKTELIVGESVTLNWASADGSACFASGGGPGDGWYGDRPATGSVELIETTPGDVDFRLECGASLPAVVGVTIKTPAALPIVRLTPSRSSVTVSEPFTLSWGAVYARSCTAGGGSGADGWVGDLDASGGSRDVTEAAAGTYDYSVTCTGADGRTVTAEARVTVNAPAAPPPSSSAVGGDSGGGGGGGGGGGMSAIDIALFLAFWLWGVGAQRRRMMRRTPLVGFAAAGARHLARREPPATFAACRPRPPVSS